MQRKSSTSRVHHWPDEHTVAEALRMWTANAVRHNARIRRVGYIGSYARGDWAPGSDLDVVVVLSETSADRFSRTLEFDASGLPVPVDLIVFTEAELDQIQQQPNRMGTMLVREARWVYPERSI